MPALQLLVHPHSLPSLGNRQPLAVKYQEKADASLRETETPAPPDVQLRFPGDASRFLSQGGGQGLENAA